MSTIWLRPRVKVRWVSSDDRQSRFEMMFHQQCCDKGWFVEEWMFLFWFWIESQGDMMGDAIREQFMQIGGQRIVQARLIGVADTGIVWLRVVIKIENQASSGSVQTAFIRHWSRLYWIVTISVTSVSSLLSRTPFKASESGLLLWRGSLHSASILSAINGYLS